MEHDFLIDEEEVPVGQKPIPAPSVAWTLIQKFSRQRKEWGRKLQESHQKRQKILSLFAIEYFEIAKSLKEYEPRLRKVGLLKEMEGLNILKSRLNDFLEKEHIKIEDPTGKILIKDIQEKVEVIQNIKSPYIKEWAVKETVEPIIYHENEIIHIGKVIALIPGKEE